MVTRFKKISDALKFFSFEPDYFSNRFPQKLFLVNSRSSLFVSAVVMEINHSNRTGVYEVCNDNILDLNEWQFFMNQPVSECSNL